MKVLTTVLLLLFTYNAFAQLDTIPFTDTIPLIRYKIGPQVQSGICYQKATEGSAYDTKYFDYTKNSLNYGLGTVLRIEPGKQYAFKIGYNYGRRYNNIIQTDFALPGNESYSYTAYNMAHEVGLMLIKNIAPRKEKSFALGVGYSFNVHQYSKNQQRVTGSSAQNVRSEITVIRSSEPFTSHSLLGQFSYLPRIYGKRPVELSINYSYDLTVSPELGISSRNKDLNGQVLQEFEGRITPVNRSLTFGLAFYVLDFSKGLRSNVFR